MSRKMSFTFDFCRRPNFLEAGRKPKHSSHQYGTRENPQVLLRLRATSYRHVYVTFEVNDVLMLTTSQLSFSKEAISDSISSLCAI
ncbi:unnamed protein product [Cyberlindnera jadinii]|uniref:Uncharacterized protein n=1 Tax=Cyberlindnera jadinii (strain ATCC 18201 / CBS 1600 / BCRC 20928 / JCM 3617 / NBRC 0987 / NRRL Y-1542) TaxID=983966 RepID=A0A0H5BYI6_CYBJN|nr:unnamed protein product [Cyberlindnera jadinii]